MRLKLQDSRSSSLPPLRPSPKTLADDDAVHLVRMAIVADPEGFFERAVADSKDESISREKFEKMFAQECKGRGGRNLGKCKAAVRPAGHEQRWKDLVARADTDD